MPILQPTYSIIDQLVHAIETAKKEILLQIFYIDNDSLFNMLSEKFIDKVKQGVCIHLLFDALGAKNISGSVVEKRLLDAGIHIRYFNWLTPWSFGNKKFWYFRNHKRALIIDEKELHMGGWCIGEKAQDWIDSYIQVTDAISVQYARQDFWNMYIYAHKVKMRFKKSIYTNKTETYIQYMEQSPTLQKNYIYRKYKKLIRISKNKIVLITPYFAPTHAISASIYKALKRKVSVEIYIPQKTDHPFVDRIAQTYIHKLLKLGARIYISPIMIHAKAALFDNLCCIGSMNLDTISLRYNFENGIYSQDTLLVQELCDDVENLKKQCIRITLEEWQKRTRWQRFFDGILKIFRGFV